MLALMSTPACDVCGTATCTPLTHCGEVLTTEQVLRLAKSERANGAASLRAQMLARWIMAIADYDYDHGAPPAPSVSFSPQGLFALIKNVDGTCDGDRHDYFVDVHGARMLAARLLKAADILETALKP